MDTQSIINILKEKKKLLQEFLNLTQEQHEIIYNKEYDELFPVIEKKKSIMEKVNLLDSEIEGKTLDSAEVVALVNTIRDIIEEAMDVDAENITTLKSNKNEVAQNLKKARKNKKTHFQYRGKNIALEGLLLDKKK